MGVHIPVWRGGGGREGVCCKEYFITIMVHSLQYLEDRSVLFKTETKNIRDLPSLHSLFCVVLQLHVNVREHWSKVHPLPNKHKWDHTLTHECTHTHTHTHTNMHVLAHTYAHTNTRTYKNTRTHTLYMHTPTNTHTHQMSVVKLHSGWVFKHICPLGVEGHQVIRYPLIGHLGPGVVDQPRIQPRHKGTCEDNTRTGGFL